MACQYGYNLQTLDNAVNNYCASNVPLGENCAIGFYSDMCKMCKTGYLVGPDYGCQADPGFTCSGRS